MQKTNSKNIVRIAAIAAIYTALSVALAPISYGMLQVRVSEALVLLPIFTPHAITGVVLGCFLTNIIGVFTGANILGVLDVFFGTFATLCAAILTYKLRNVKTFNMPIASAIPPIILNAIIIGLELTYLFMGKFELIVFLTQCLWIALGQTVSCLILGLLLVKVIQKTPALKNIFTG